jgi:hypothetical protein
MSANPPAPTKAAGNRLDVAIEWASGATAVGMFAYGYALSYSVLYSIATAVGLPAWAARVWPLGFESLMASAALNALAEQRHRRHLPSWWRRVPWYPWTLTALTAGASLLLNWFHPAIPLDPPPSWLRSLVYGLPPLAAVFAWHLFLQRVTHRHRPATPDSLPSASEALDGPADTTVARLGTPPGPDTSGPAVDAQGVRALSAPDTPPVRPLPPGNPSVLAADGSMDAPGVQPASVSVAPARGVRDRLAAAYANRRVDGGAWSARTLAQAAGCGRSTAAAFLRQQRQTQQQEPAGEGVAR